MVMPRINMRKFREILRLKLDIKLSNREIARTLNLSPGAVSNYTRPFVAKGTEWRQLQDLSDQDIEKLLYPTKDLPSKRELVQPDFIKIHRELKIKNVTLQLLWEEYHETHRDKAYGRTQFCKMYQFWRKKQNVSMRQTHKAGDKLFIDYAGSTVPVIDKDLGDTRHAQIFIAVMGASSYIFAEATWSQTMVDWIGSHVRAFSFFGGVPSLLVPDNLKSAINKACRYEPDTNATYAEMAAYYGTAVLPARPAKPKDKAKAEVSVQIISRWILARLRHMKFFSLFELNQAIARLLTDANLKAFKKLPGSRLSQFKEIDFPALKPLPITPYVYSEFKKAVLGIDYHVEIAGHYYSAPYQLAKEILSVRYTEKTVEIFHKNNRVASHARSYRKGGHTTTTDHMPIKHQKHMKWTPGRILNWAQSVGPKTLDLTKELIEKKAHPEQAYRACLGLLNLSKQFGVERLEAACHRAFFFNTPNRHHVVSILKKGLDKQPLPDEYQEYQQSIHENIRGSQYFSQTP